MDNYSPLDIDQKILKATIATYSVFGPCPKADRYSTWYDLQNYHNNPVGLIFQNHHFILSLPRINTKDTT